MYIVYGIIVGHRKLTLKVRKPTVWVVEMLLWMCIFSAQCSIISEVYVASCNVFNWRKNTSLYSYIWDFLLSQINIWTTTTWSNVWVVLPKPFWYEFLIGFLTWTPASKYLHLTTFSNMCVILSTFLYL